MFQGLNRSGGVMSYNNRLVRSSACLYDILKPNGYYLTQLVTSNMA